MNKPENTDTWPEIVKVLDKYSMEAWRAGVISERERIIKLIEDNWPEDIPSKLDDYWSGYEAVIALIKGETND